MENVQRLVTWISPTICLPGHGPLVHSIYQMRERIREGGFPEKISVTKEVYEPVAAQLDRSKDSVIKGVARAVNACWMDGQNPALNNIIGTRLRLKPTSKEFITYCAYYLAFGKPYHRPEEPTQL